MTSWRTSLALAVGLATLCVAPSPCLAGGAALRTLEGEVVELRRLPGEENLELLGADLRIDGEEAPITVLIAPPELLEQVGFVVEPGDRLRTRVFIEEQPVRVHKLMNITRRSMVRVRTLRMAPLWDGQGRWYGTSPGGAGSGAGSSGGSGAGKQRRGAGGPGRASR